MKYCGEKHLCVGVIRYIKVSCAIWEKIIAGVWNAVKRK